MLSFKVTGQKIYIHVCPRSEKPQGILQSQKILSWEIAGCLGPVSTPLNWCQAGAWLICWGLGAQFSDVFVSLPVSIAQRKNSHIL